jgi:Rho guanine nucleotide exchange factor 7
MRLFQYLINVNNSMTVQRYDILFSQEIRSQWFRIFFKFMAYYLPSLLPHCKSLIIRQLHGVFLLNRCRPKEAGAPPFPVLHFAKTTQTTPFSPSTTPRYHTTYSSMRFIYSSTRFIYSSTRFICSSTPFIYSSMRLIYSSTRFINSSMRLISSSMQLINSSMRLINSSMQLINSSMRRAELNPLITNFNIYHHLTVKFLIIY